MKIGITYNLRQDNTEAAAEFDSLDTVVAIETSLRNLGHQPDFIGNAKNLTKRLVHGAHWDLVFNIAEGEGNSRESQVPTILDVYNIPYTFSDPLTLDVCLHKHLAKTFVRQAGIQTPDWLIIDNTDQIPCFPFFPVFIKPNAEGTSKGISSNSLVRDYDSLVSRCKGLLKQYPQVLIETYLPGREFTAGIVNNKIIGTIEIITKNGVYSYTNKLNYQSLVQYEYWPPGSVHHIEEVALKAWQILKCRDAGRIDIRCDSKNKPNFLEANPLPGLNPVSSDLTLICKYAKIPYIELINSIIKSARSRL